MEKLHIFNLFSLYSQLLGPQFSCFYFLKNQNIINPKHLLLVRIHVGVGLGGLGGKGVNLVFQDQCSISNKIGLQPVSKPVKQEVGLLRDVQRGLAIFKFADKPQ